MKKLVGFTTSQLPFSLAFFTARKIKKRKIPVIFADVPDMSMVRVGKHLLHEQHYHAHEPGCAHYEIKRFGKLETGKLCL